MTEYTKEKLELWPYGNGSSIKGCINIVAPESEVILVADILVGEAERMVACWNAMQGIADPESFMRDVRKAIDSYSMREVSDNVTIIGKHLPND